jgi:cation transport regulator ChaC
MTQSPSKPVKAERELSREMILDGTFLKTSTAYIDRWVTIETDDGSHGAITFVASPEFEGYAPSMTNEEIAAAIVAAKGTGGTCVDDFRQTLDHLRDLKMQDDGLESINHLILGLLAHTSPDQTIDCMKPIGSNSRPSS